VLRARRAVHLESSRTPEREHRLADRAGGAVHEDAGTFVEVGDAVEHLIRGRPAEDHGRSLGRIDAWRHATDVLGAKRTELGVRSGDGEVSDAIADREVSHARTDLIDLADDVVAEHQRKHVADPGIAMPADDGIGELYRRRQHANAHLARTGLGHGCLGDLDLFGPSESS